MAYIIFRAAFFFMLLGLAFCESWENNPSSKTMILTAPYLPSSSAAGGATLMQAYNHPARTTTTTNSAIPSSSTHHNILSSTLLIPRGGGYLPAGWNPFGYAITDLGLEFLKIDGSLDSDVGRFLASLKKGRKKHGILRDQWVEIVRVSKSGQSMRILRTMDDLIEFCLKAGFLD
jgi:hypothetical protein